MWAWWLIFLLFAGALGYFVSWLIFSSRKFHIEIYGQQERQPPRIRSPFSRSSKESTSVLTKLQEIEDKVNQYTDRQYQLLSQLEKLEHSKLQPKQVVKGDEASENEFEEMYYEARDKKEALEEEVEKLSAVLAEKEKKLAEKEVNRNEEAEVLSKTDFGDQEKKNLQRTIELLEYKLEAAAEREAELDKQLEEKILALQHAVKLKSHNADLQSELDELKAYVDMLRKRSSQAEVAKSRVAELQFELHTKEEEHKTMRLKVEEIAQENQKLAEKIRELQQKLQEETYRINSPGSKN